MWHEKLHLQAENRNSGYSLLRSHQEENVLRETKLSRELMVISSTVMEDEW